MHISSSYLLVMPKYWGKQIFSLGSFLKWVTSKRRRGGKSQSPFWEPQFKGNYFLPNAVIPSLKLVKQTCVRISVKEKFPEEYLKTSFVLFLTEIISFSQVR